MGRAVEVAGIKVKGIYQFRVKKDPTQDLPLKVYIKQRIATLLTHRTSPLRKAKIRSR
jgi:hypothetical protein